MKKVFIGSLFLLGILFVSPVAVSAHGVSTDVDSPVTEEMMVGDVVDAQHQEMEELMVKMMTNQMTEEEARRMIAIMQDKNGGMGAMMGMGSKEHGKEAGVMGTLGYGYMHSGIGASGVVLHGGLLVALVLLGVWLWRRGNSK